ncbi:short chain dehydrogenase [Aestuariivirga sp.]|uniref:short chain dehydrogenase n=1 Tax=Aestuariivirga sp. TaxID=2650926 RepID=UPI0025BEB88C|nr:short chain dehydrogenase [Aestuariivirga sp.]MCA3554615.1 short chain dehydrogenase [Aestuariivirga sp.]
MRILIVGDSGTVGKAAAAELGRRHDIIRAGRSSGDLIVDAMREESVKAMYAKLGKVDAIVTCLGHVHFGPVATMSPEQFRIGLNDKLMGQVNLFLLGMNNVNDNGSFTLTSGILDRDPVRAGANAAAVNGAIGAFVKGAAIEMPRGLRINAVSPGLLEDSAAKYDGFFPGHEPVSSARVGLAYAKSVEGALTGQVICVG